ncbi:hypothetical protein U5922_009000 [Aquicoccus sp. G2-2]|uniref:hypothetical protein n=1 Tax=Aquicoccus sp. G2-2 TaxID=3092120 RepID=UPI003671C1F2
MLTFRAKSLGVILSAALIGAGLHAQTTADLQTTADVGAAGQVVPLYLAVTINGKSTGLVAEFTAQLDGSEMRTTHHELTDLGIRAKRGWAAARWRSMILTG